MRTSRHYLPLTPIGAPGHGAGWPYSFVFARLRLETGSVWPAITLHSAWNAVIQTAFDAASTGARAELWIGESGSSSRSR